MVLKQVSLVLLLFFQTYVVCAHEQTKILLHMNDVYKLSHLQRSVQNLRNELGNDVHIRVVINGKAVQLMLKTDKTSVTVVDSMLENNVEIGLCHNAVRNNNVKTDMLIEGVSVLETDGNVTIINLQREGYRYIKI